MPTYDYHCPTCGCEFTEYRVPVRWRDVVVCKQDGCNAWAERQPATPAIQFKGSGFYVNDYKKKSS